MVDPLDPGELREYDVVYRRDRDTAWLARVYAPADGGPFPALLDVHGGAWSGGTRMANAHLDRALAATGMVVVAVDFRLGPDHPYPASIADVHYAARWLKRHAVQLNATPEPLGALGTSSGGHMALLCAMRPDDLRYAALPLPDGEEGGRPAQPRERAAPAAATVAGESAPLIAYVVACWPPVDPLARYRFARETGRHDLVRNTEGYFRTEAAMRDGSAQHLLDRLQAGTIEGTVALPPVQLIQGTADGNIPLPMIERFAASYRAAGGELELALFEGEPHGFGAKPGAASDRALEQIKAFVRRHGSPRP